MSQSVQDPPFDASVRALGSGARSIYIVCAAFLVSHPKAGVPHLASIHAPGIENIGMFEHDVASKVEEGFIMFHRIVRLAIHDRERPRVDIFFPVESRNQLIERFKVSVMLCRFERVDDNRVNLAWSRSAGLFGGSPTVRCAAATPVIVLPRSPIIHQFLVLSGISAVAPLT